MRRIFSPYIFICISVIAIFSCGGKNSTGKKVFSYNEASGIATLDPAFAKSQSLMWAAHQLYNTLVEVDSNLNIVPSLARSWEVSPDHRVFTFHLRSDVFFQDNPAFAGMHGRKMVAQDVMYSLKRIMDPTVASSGAWIFNGKVTGDGFAALDDSTFQLKLVRPFHPILGILSMQYCSILPWEVVKKYGADFRRNACGTGPFQLKYWDEGQALVLEKNPHYWERDTLGRHLPYLDAVSVSFADNKATEFLQFRQHKLSFINDIDPSFKDEVLSKKGDLRKEWQGKIILQKHPYLNIEYFGILMDAKNPLVKNSPLKLKKIRQAINYGINRQQLMLYMRNSIGTAATAGFVPEGLPSENTKYVHGYGYNPAKAAALLREAGFPNGENLPAIRLLTIPQYADFASFAARQLQNIGIAVQVETVQKSLLLQQTSRSEALFFRGSWIADYPDAENYMAVFYGSNPAPPNYTRYANPLFDRLYEKSLQETNDSLRYIMYRQMDQMMIDDAPVVPLFYDQVIHLVQPGISGFPANALNLLELRYVAM